jgi:hypothetical protein
LPKKIYRKVEKVKEVKEVKEVSQKNLFNLFGCELLVRFDFAVPPKIYPFATFA